MLQLIKLAGLLPVFGKLATWLIDKWMTDPKEREEARARLQAAIDRVSNNPNSEAQDVSDQWRTIQTEPKQDTGSGSPK